MHFVYKELYFPDLDDSISDSNASVPSANIIGDYCLGLDIDKNIVNSCFSETSYKFFKLNDGAIIELHDSLRNKKKYLSAKIQWDHISAFVGRF